MTRSSWSSAASRGEPRRARRHHIGEGIVLDDGEIVMGGDLQQAMGDRQGNRAAGRIMRQRLGEEDLRPVPGDLGGEIVEIRPVGQAADAGDLDAPELQLAEERVIAGAVDQNGVTGLEQMADDQVECVVDAEGHQDLRRRSLNRALGQHQADLGTQRPIADRIAIAVLDRQIVLAAAQTQMAAEFGILHPGRGRAPVADPNRMDLAKLLAQQRDDVDRLGHMLWRRLAGTMAGGADIEAGATPGLEPAAGNEPVIDLDHGVLRDAVFAGGSP